MAKDKSARVELMRDPGSPAADTGTSDSAYEVRANNAHFNSQQGFPTNYIRTTKYTILTFLPLNLFEQFRRLSNFYFLVSMIVALIPGVSPVFPITSILPLVFVLTVGAIKDGIEDYERYKADKEANSTMVTVLRNGKQETIQTHEVRVGDIVYVEKGAVFPADLLLLSASQHDGNCYVETSNLDGETNLKLRKAHTDTMKYGSPEELTKFDATLQCEEPNEALYKFHGRLVFDESHFIALSEKQLLLRGSQLRNTKWVYGLCVYAGVDTKMFKNLQKKVAKFSSIDKKLNRFVLALFVTQQVLCGFGAMMSVIFQDSHSRDAWYLTGFNNYNGWQLFFTQYLTYFVLYNVLIPISLFVSLEIVRVCQARFMEWDPQLQARGKKMVAKTSALNDELGRIEWVFSDKTGTLTENIMEFSKCTIEGFVHDEIANPGLLKQILTQGTPSTKANKETITEFLTALAVCHDVVPEWNEKANKMNFEAQSPDEVALVDAAVSNGFELLARSSEGVRVRCLGEEVLFKVLAVLEFNADRKRMSVIVRRSDNNKLICYCKGADSIMFPRLSSVTNTREVKREITENLKDFAKEGLRTLVLGSRELTEDEYSSWKSKFDVADASIEGRDNKIAEVSELMERDLFMLGATAIEDKLQPEVPETIQFLLDAGIIVWVLTGDKRETAVNIAYSSRLLDDSMDVLHVEAENSEKCGAQLQQYIEQFLPKVAGQPLKKRLAVVIDGHSLQYALDDHAEKFLKIGLVCHAAICCRITPLQKALVVRLVEKNTSKIGLAIGDGANDVSMISEAKVGIGIIGVEGTQAARASDYAIPQFRHLRRLLAVHGRYSYVRAGDLIQYSFYKNLIVCWCQLFYAFFNGFTGQTMIDSWILLFYNMTFTALPPLFMGIFEKDLSEKLIMSHPFAYQHTQKGSSCTWWTFGRWVLNSVIHSVIVYWSFHSFSQTAVWSDNGQTFGIWAFGTLMASALITIALIKAGLESRNWTWLTHMALWGSLLAYWLFLLAYSSSVSVLGSGNMYWVVYRLFSLDSAWLIFIWSVTTCVIIDVGYKYLQWQHFPYTWQLLMELKKRFGITGFKSQRVIADVDDHM